MLSTYDFSSRGKTNDRPIHPYISNWIRNGNTEKYQGYGGKGRLAKDSGHICYCLINVFIGLLLKGITAKKSAGFFSILFHRCKKELAYLNFIIYPRRPRYHIKQALSIENMISIDNSNLEQIIFNVLLHLLNFLFT